MFILSLRSGKLVESSSDIFELIDNIEDELSYYISVYYEKNYKPKEILIPSNLALTNLKDLLNIDSVDRIEVFDNSHLFGTFTVSGMVVFILGKESKKEYRKYKIISESKDDYNIMKEVIYRRYFRVLIDKLELPNLNYSRWW